MASPDRRDEREPLDLPPPRRTFAQRFALWLERGRALPGRVEEARGRSAVLDTGFEWIERDSEIGGGILSGALAYRLFIFTLPLAFFLVSVLGLASDAANKSPKEIARSVGLLGLVTSQVASTSKEHASAWVGLTSFFILVYMTRVLLRAVSIVHALAWEHSGRAVKVKMRSLGVFAVGVAAMFLLVVAVGALRHETSLPGLFATLASGLGFAAIWLWVSLSLPHADARWYDLIPGSLVFGIGILCVQVFNVYFLTKLLQNKATTYGALGVAAAILLGLFFIGRVVVLSASLNATLYERRTRHRDDEVGSPT
ncbi:MAG TPA: YhjD/YihY/BrkB family envelope integrity protein [Gaiellaceae bacterium]|nr:YhjD/YihY/BrkB family envelope integrity protein [Gaiellaceae bacterium]